MGGTGDGAIGDRVRLALVGVAGLAQLRLLLRRLRGAGGLRLRLRLASRRRRLGRSGALLDHVRELVSDQVLAVGAVGIELARREMNVRALGERLRADLRRPIAVGVDPDRAEVGTELRFHLRAQSLGQRLRRWRRRGVLRCLCRFGLGSGFSGGAFGLLALDAPAHCHTPHQIALRIALLGRFERLQVATLRSLPCVAILHLTII